MLYNLMRFQTWHCSFLFGKFIKIWHKKPIVKYSYKDKSKNFLQGKVTHIKFPLKSFDEGGKTIKK